MHEEEKTVVKTDKTLGVFAMALTLVFVIAKVFGFGLAATWSWWTVFLPVLIYFGIGLVLLVGLLLFAIIIVIFDK